MLGNIKLHDAGTVKIQQSNCKSKYTVRTDGTSVGRDGLSGRSVRVAHHQDVINPIGTGTEGIPKNPDRSQDDLGVISGGLVGGRAVKVPLGQILDLGGAVGGEGPGLGAGGADGVDPDVLGEDCGDTE